MSTTEAALKKAKGIGCRRGPQAIDIDRGDSADTGGSGFDGHGCGHLSAFQVDYSKWARTTPGWTRALSAPPPHRRIDSPNMLVRWVAEDGSARLARFAGACGAGSPVRAKRFR
jgi:hypothetical protein